jgi:hypothetical protein
MINKTLSQKGSAHVVIIVILVIALLGTLGFVFWQNFIHKDTLDTSNTAKVESKQENTNENAKKSDQLTLSDWAIKFTISSSLTSTEVKYQAKGTDTYVFTTARIQALGGECVKSPFGDTVNLARMTEKPVATPDGELLNESPINNYYYVLSGPISSCSSLDSNQQPVNAVNPVETADRDALKTTLKTLSAK